MIDWISATVPYDWDVPVNGGSVVHFRADGSFERGTQKTLHLTGSYDGRFAVRTVERGKLEISGNPAKFLQGHNLFGCDDPRGLVYDALEVCTNKLGLEPSPENRLAWLRGEYKLSRIDITSMYELGSFSDVASWILAASKSANIKWRGRGHYQDGTLYFGKVAKGKRASTWQLKLYHKGAEVLVPGHRLPEDLPMKAKLEEWASDKLRIELTLRSQELDRLGLQSVSKWTQDIVSRVFGGYLDKLEIGEGQMVDALVEDDMKPRLRAAYALWKTGCDLRAVYKRTQFYQLRAELLSIANVDIGTICPVDNVIPLRRALEARPVGVPEWAGSLCHVPRTGLRAVA